MTRAEATKLYTLCPCLIFERICPPNLQLPVSPSSTVPTNRLRTLPAFARQPRHRTTTSKPCRKGSVLNWGRNLDKEL